MKKLMLVLLVVLLGGCASGGKQTVTATARTEVHDYWMDDSKSKTLGILEYKYEHVY